MQVDFYLILLRNTVKFKEKKEIFKEIFQTIYH